MKYTKLIQRHKPKPPLCKAPEAAVQRRCGDHVSGGRVVKTEVKASMCKPTTPQTAYAASSPYTGEPIEVRTDLIQRHKLTPPLCKGRGTTLVVEGLSKARKSYDEQMQNLQPLSHLTVPAPLTQGSLSKSVQTQFSSTNQSLPCVRGGGPPMAVEGL